MPEAAEVAVAQEVTVAVATWGRDTDVPVARLRWATEGIRLKLERNTPTGSVEPKNDTSDTRPALSPPNGSVTELAT